MDDTIAFLKEYPNRTPADIASRAHRIAGSAATLGAVELRNGLIKVEETAKSGDAQAMGNAIAALPAIWDASRPHMRVDRRTTTH